MGELIQLKPRRSSRRNHCRRETRAFYFDLGCPFSYLAAEPVERVLGDVEWVPSAPFALPAGVVADAPLAPIVARAAERQAARLRLPLIWPERTPLEFPCAMRAAAYAAQAGRACAFALAASRLAFCGGYDLDDPEIIAEAAAAAALSPAACLAAAGAPEWDVALQAMAHRLRARGVQRLPAIRVGRRWCQGEGAVAEATALVQVGARRRGALSMA